ncbi:tryptophan 7-halogenase [Pseudoalteromonas sp. NZS71_1]|uniref:tryptophan halogenase family protein n=1 Tax=Pseudoalteromonas sp. NZS71_1 TaxID=2792072 RepID=UPI0018CDED89|nr:tryptophan halogenase family protein [Pseudoalteromonas sp. NZS71_1]MBH0035874.1 tryptophan 7-halogenase [Pseudoalteromonas sp. NZS71_1]
MNKAIKTVAVVGGGTAGWLSAAIIASYHQGQNGDGLKVMLVESSDIPTIGVGEGTWPTMKNTLQQIGLREVDVFKACNATFKQGGKFVNWTHGNNDFYYHPFTVPLGYGRIDLAPYLDNVEDFAQQTNFQHDICEASLAPRGIAQGEYQGNCNYAYHLDAGAFAEMLKQHCKSKLGVEHIIGTVDQVKLDDDGAINVLTLKGQTRTINADLFIDCTGFSSLLLGQALNVPFKKMDHVLFNDSALAMQVPYDENEQLLASHTIATAQNAGWIWDIGLTHRRGVGHVYSSKFLSDDEAEQNLRNYLGDAANGLTARKISFESGYREKFWHKNCVAIGMSAGFVEPLEATAIMLVEISARFVAEHMPADTQVMPIVAKRFNEQMDYRWQRIIDFLKLHYMLTKRPEPYWQAHVQPDTIPQTLQEDLLLWGSRGPLIQDFHGALELFPAASYQYVLYGMGFKPDFTKQAYLYSQHVQAKQIIERNSQLTQQMLQTLPPHRAFIEQWLAANPV